MPTIRAVRPVLAALAAIIALLALPGGASAHAQLESTVPPSGAVVARQPAQVDFRFGEGVQAGRDAVRVYDGAGKQVQRGGAYSPGGDAKQIAIRLRPGLPQGTYTATYRLISADGHPISGGVVFSVGRASRTATSLADALAGSTAGPVTATTFAVARGIQYTAIAVGLGVLAFLVVLLGPALRRRPDGDEAVARRRVLRIVLGAAVAGTLSAAAGVVLEGAQGAGVSFFSALDPDVLGDSLGTRFGKVWALGSISWIVVGVVAFLAFRTPRPASPPVAGEATRATPGPAGGEARSAGALLPGSDRRLIGLLPFAAFLLVLPALAGHGSSQSPVGLLFPSITIHVASVTAWIGGIAALLLVLPAALRALPESARLGVAADVLGRFSRVAFVAVWIVAITGAVQAYVLVRHPEALLDTGYGRSVTLKTLLLVALAVVATGNHRRSVPRLRALAAADPAGAVPVADGPTAAATGARLRRAVRIEAALIVVVLGVTAALSTYPPGTARQTSKPKPPEPFSATRPVGPLQARIDVTPGGVGPNRIVLRLTDPRTGRPFTGAKEVDLAEALPAQDIPALQQTAKAAGPGRFLVDGAPLSVAGTWTVAVSVRVSDFDQYETTVEVPVR
ncbi:copper resistance CopC/CopD family protein [Patulibacter minatonensis]|uniref:copper resistance CopC/CopD family protein n=1 Tax=Patulibacter minatonensis TaxID=298163 RepID=UPI0004786A0B|nr:copper resistance protein CopC [Patulibacter minatonensis]